MEQKDRLAYELAMATLQDAREDCLRWLEDQAPVPSQERSSRWWSLDLPPIRRRRPLAS